jgi:hypothetical protein
MIPRPPVQPLRESLPFQDSAFGWDTFEDFFCDFLNAQPVIILNDNGDEIRQRVIRRSVGFPVQALQGMGSARYS